MVSTSIAMSSSALFASYILILVVLLSTSCGVTNGEYLHYKNKASKLFGKYLIPSFGLSTGGLLTVDYKLTANYTLTEYNSNIFILLISEQQKINWYSQLNNANNIASTCQSPTIYRRQIFGAGTFEYTLPSSLVTNLYSVAIVQCRTPLKGAVVTFDVEVTLENPTPDGNGYSQLPIEHVFIVRVFLAEIIIYSIFFIAMLTQLYFSNRWFRKIHYLFMFCCATQIVTLSVVYRAYTLFDETGIDSAALSVWYNVTRHITDVVVYSTILLLSLGYSLTREVLSAREVKLGSGVISLYLILGLFAATCRTEETCASLNLMTYVIRTIILLGIIVGMNFTVTQLKASILQSPWTQSMPMQYLRARQYSQFRIAFIIFLLGPTAILLVQAAVYTWREEWLPYTLSEVLVILMFLHVGINFSPIHETKVIRAFDGSYNAIHID